jgi:hypothetical protein
MTAYIPISIAVEDQLSDAVVRKILSFSNPSFCVGQSYYRNGKGYLKKGIKGFNSAAKWTPYFVLTDLDNEVCPRELIDEWLPNGVHHNLIFRVAVKEVESWIMADRKSFADFLGIRQNLVPSNLDTIYNPKEKLIELAKRSRYVSLREEIVPPKHSERKIGPNYNGSLIAYINEKWQPDYAAKNSISLSRALNTLKSFQPLLLS